MQINELSRERVSNGESARHRIFVYNFCHVANWTKSRIGRSLSGHKRQQKLKQINFWVPSLNFSACCCCCCLFFSLSFGSFVPLVFEKGNFHVYRIAAGSMCVCQSLRIDALSVNDSNYRARTNGYTWLKQSRKKGPYKHTHTHTRRLWRERASEFFINMIAIVHTLS